MGTWTSYSSARNWVQSQYVTAMNTFDVAMAQITDAWTDWYVPNDHAALAHALNAITSAVWIGYRDTTGHADMTDNFANVWLFDYIYPKLAGAIDMDDILSAMVAADYDELQYFVGLTDAYKVAIWNQPFNAEFYAALARGFTP